MGYHQDIGIPRQNSSLPSWFAKVLVFTSVDLDQRQNVPWCGFCLKKKKITRSLEQAVMQSVAVMHIILVWLVYGIWS